MQAFYMQKEGCGVNVVYDQGEVERHKKLGWELVPADFHQKVLDKGKETRLRILKEQQAAAAAQLAELEQQEAVEVEAPAPKKPGRPKKVA